MRKVNNRRAIVSLFLLILPLLACNLTRTPPTPTAPPATAIQPTSIAPTLFPSITPLGNGGGVIATIPAPVNPACPPPQGWVAYVIEPGDSLSALAQEMGVTLQDLMNANCITDPDTLFAGQTIYLPRSPVSG